MNVSILLVKCFEVSSTVRLSTLVLIDEMRKLFEMLSCALTDNEDHKPIIFIAMVESILMLIK